MPAIAIPGQQQQGGPTTTEQMLAQTMAMMTQLLAAMQQNQQQPAQQPVINVQMPEPRAPEEKLERKSDKYQKNLAITKFNPDEKKANFTTWWPHFMTQLLAHNPSRKGIVTKSMKWVHWKCFEGWFQWEPLENQQNPDFLFAKLKSMYEDRTPWHVKSAAFTQCVQTENMTVQQDTNEKIKTFIEAFPNTRWQDSLLKSQNKKYNLEIGNTS